MINQQSSIGRISKVLEKELRTIRVNGEVIIYTERPTPKEQFNKAMKYTEDRILHRFQSRSGREASRAQKDGLKDLVVSEDVQDNFGRYSSRQVVALWTKPSSCPPSFASWHLSSGPCSQSPCSFSSSYTGSSSSPSPATPAARMEESRKIRFRGGIFKSHWLVF